jgi:predicted dehydrogenase
MAKLRIGYVGCGFMAQKVHLPNLATLDECELVALAELRPKLGRQVQDRFRIPRLYPDHLALAEDPAIDAVAVSAAFHIQGAIARDLLLAGKNVFMEKPMAISVAQGEEIVNASTESGSRLMVGYMKRFDAGNELVKTLVSEFRASGELGEVTFARNHGFCGDWVAGMDMPMIRTDEPMPQSEPTPPDWLPADRFSDYVGFLQQYTHNINLLRFFLDAGKEVRVRHVDLDVDGYTGVTILEIAGIRVVLETGRLSHYRWDEHTQVYFRDGWIKTWAPPLLQRNAAAEVEVYRAGSTQTFSHPIPEPRWSWSYRRELEHFVRQVISGEPFRSSAEDTMTDIRLFEEIYRMHLGIDQG